MPPWIEGSAAPTRTLPRIGIKRESAHCISRFGGGYRQPSLAYCNHELSPLPAGEGEGQATSPLIPSPSPTRGEGSKENPTPSTRTPAGGIMPPAFFASSIAPAARAADPHLCNLPLPLSSLFPARSVRLASMRFASALNSRCTARSCLRSLSHSHCPTPRLHCC